jgi:hypothetical protein
MRQALINENPDLVQADGRYVMRITGDDAEGCAEVGNFIDPEDEGVTNLDDPLMLKIAPFDAMGTLVELLKPFGGRAGFEKAVHELQSALYSSAA